MTFTDTILQLSNSLLNHFKEVYHSAQIVTTDSIRKPMVAQASEWIDLSPTDQATTLYIRRNGDDEVYQPLQLGSCDRAYQMRTQLRVVYFQDRADHTGETLAHLMQSVLLTNIKLNRIIQDKYRLQKEESTGAYTLGPTSAYFAIDLYAIWDLEVDTCEQDFCVTLPNPMCHVES